MADPTEEIVVNNFFMGFMNRLNACNPSNIENNIQNIEQYNQTRENCQQVFRDFMPTLETLVQRLNTPPPNTNTIRISLIDLLILGINEVLLHSVIFENIEQTNQPAQPEFGIEGHQGRSELSLVNHYDKLQELRTRLIDRRDELTGHISSGGRKKRRKSMKKRRKLKKKKNTKKKQKRKYYTF